MHGGEWTINHANQGLNVPAGSTVRRMDASIPLDIRRLTKNYTERHGFRVIAVLN